jgi:hypothetical protein
MDPLCKWCFFTCISTLCVIYSKCQKISLTVSYVSQRTHITYLSVGWLTLNQLWLPKWWQIWISSVVCDMNSIHREKWVENIFQLQNLSYCIYHQPLKIIHSVSTKIGFGNILFTPLGMTKKNQIQTFLVSYHICANPPGTAILASKLLCRCGLQAPN